MMKQRKLWIALVIVLLAGCLGTGAWMIGAGQAKAEPDAGSATEALGDATPGGDMPSQVGNDLESLRSRLVAAGVPVLDVSTKVPDAYAESVVAADGQPTDPLALVCVSVPESSLSQTDGLLTMASIKRQAVFAVRDGVPLKLLCILSVDDQGQSKNCGLMAVNRLATPSATWNQPAKLPLANAQNELRRVIDQAAEEMQVAVVKTAWSESADGRTVAISAGWSGEGRPGAFVDVVSRAIRLMNENEGCKVITLTVEFESTSARAIACYVADYEIGRLSLGERIAPEHIGDPAFEPAMMR